METTQIDLSGIDGLMNRYFGDKAYLSSSPNTRYYSYGSQVAEGIYNPIAVLGYMSPANDTTKAVSGTTPYLLTSALTVPASLRSSVSSNAIFFGDESVDTVTGKIMKLDTAVDTSLSQAYEIPTFGSPAQYGRVEDMILYTVNGQQHTFFAYRNTTGNIQHITVGYATPSFGTVAPVWSQGTGMVAVPQGSRPTLILSDNGLLYLLESNAIHRIDGGPTAGSTPQFTENVLLFLGSRTGSVFSPTHIIDGVDMRGRMWVGLHINQNFGIGAQGNLNERSFTQDVGVYIWDRRTTVAGAQDYIPIVGVRELKSMHRFQGQPACFTISSDGYTQFRMWNGSEFKLIKTLGKNAYPAYRKHSVHEDGDIIYWLGQDGKVYAFGKIEPELSNALYIIGDMTGHVTSGQTYVNSGVLVAANATETVSTGNDISTLAFYISFSDTAGNHLKKWYPHSFDLIDSNQQKANQGNVYTAVKYLPINSTVKNVQMFCLPTNGVSTDAIATVKYYFNQKTTPSITKTITEKDASRGYVTHEINKRYVHAIQIEIEWSTTETAGRDYFRPSFALIEHEATSTIKNSGTD